MSDTPVPPPGNPPPGALPPKKPAGPPASGSLPPKPAGPPAGTPPPSGALPPKPAGPPSASTPAPKPAGPPTGAPPPAAKPAAAPVSAPAAAPSAKVEVSADKPGVPPAKPPAQSLTPGVSIQGAAKTDLPAPAVGNVSRREFLNYVWGASMALFMAQFAGVSFFFAFPRFRAGEQGGKFNKVPTDFPAVGEKPNADGVGKFWMIRTPEGAYVHYRVCTHLGCIFAYDDTAQGFACPCHGSQFQRNGDWKAGPAPRGLDRFPVKIYDAAGAVLVDAADGGPFQIPDNAARVEIDTGKKLTGKSHLV